MGLTEFHPLLPQCAANGGCNAAIIPCGHAEDQRCADVDGRDAWARAATSLLETEQMRPSLMAK